MRMLLTFVTLGFFSLALVAQEPLGRGYDPDGYESENKAKSVRPAKPRERSAAPPSRSGGDSKDDPKSGSKSDKVYAATDVAGLVAMKGKEVTVRGRVTSVYSPSSETIFIMNFGPDRKTCFKAVIFKRNFDKWDGGLEGLKKLVSRKTVTIEGVVTIYEDAPQIQINIPSQLKVEN
ncbi:MAG TPA: hypothetical protein PKD86_04380 [Gemmatales bacterium]|nr:hypothetical protein [Gemmatales bacterium]HMP58569.1 hypothetical protein [Gemmatales bacterium]